MMRLAKLVAVRTGVPLVALGLWWAGLGCSTGMAAPPAQPAAADKSTIYDPDPQHLWNRLQRAVWVRTGPDGKEYGHDRLDLLLWRETKHLLEGKSYEQAIAVLDEFLMAHGENLVKAPLKRAILQRDLWAVFDWTTEPSVKERQVPRRALQSRLARIIQRLALAREQIKGLPDNYAQALASRAFAAKHNPDHPEGPFLPPDLLQADGSWVEVQLDNSSRVTASRHVYDFGARSAFRVFLRFPEGRRATIAYMAKLSDFPQPWLLKAEPVRKRDMLRLNSDLPQFPVGTQAALVRQMLLIDKEGELATTRITESVQFRVFRAIPKLESEQDPLLGRVRMQGEPDPQDSYEFTLKRALLFAGNVGGLRPRGPDDKDFRTQLLVHGYDVFELDDNVPLEYRMGQPMRGCLGCHDRPGIYSFRTYTGGDYPRGQYYLPDLEENRPADEQGALSANNKREQYSWGLLCGLWQDQPGR